MFSEIQRQEPLVTYQFFGVTASTEIPIESEKLFWPFDSETLNQSLVKVLNKKDISSAQSVMTQLRKIWNARGSTFTSVRFYKIQIEPEKNLNTKKLLVESK